MHWTSFSKDRGTWWHLIFGQAMYWNHVPHCHDLTLQAIIDVNFEDVMPSVLPVVNNVKDTGDWKCTLPSSFNEVSVDVYKYTLKSSYVLTTQLGVLLIVQLLFKEDGRFFMVKLFQMIQNAVFQKHFWALATEGSSLQIWIEFFLKT